MFRWLLRLLGFSGDTKPKTPPPSLSKAEVEPVVPASPALPAGVVLPVEPVPETSEDDAPRIVLAESSPMLAPWTTVESAPALEPVVVQRHLRDHLQSLSDSAATKADQRFVDRLLQQVGTDQLDLPPFPAVARELDDLLKQTTTDILQIARVVERDPGMVRRVWTHARSAMYASAPRSLHHAVARVGLDALWRIGMSVCLNDTVFRVDGMQNAAESVRHHGIATAEVAALLGGERRGSIYLAGLLHGIGELIVLQVAASKRERAPSHEVVRKVADEVGAALGVLVVHSWKLDETVVVGVGHAPDPAQAPESLRRVAQIVRAASIAAHASRLAREGIVLESVDPVAEIQALGFDPMQALSRADAVYNEIYEGAGAQ